MHGETFPVCPRNNAPWRNYTEDILVFTRMYHRICEAGKERPLRSVQPVTNHCHVNQTLALSAMSSLSLNISRDGDSTASLGSPFQWLNTDLISLSYLYTHTYIHSKIVFLEELNILCSLLKLKHNQNRKLRSLHI